MIYKINEQKQKIKRQQILCEKIRNHEITKKYILRGNSMDPLDRDPPLTIQK